MLKSGAEMKMRGSTWLLAALAAGLLATQMPSPLFAQEPVPPALPPLWEPPADISLSVAPPPGVLLLPMPAPGPAPQAPPPDAPPPTVEETPPPVVEEVPLPVAEEIPPPPPPETLPAGETPPPVIDPPLASNQPSGLEVPGAQVVDEGATLRFAVKVSDPDAGQAVSVQTSLLPEGASFDGTTFTWEPSYAQAGTYTVRFMALDNGTPPMSSAQLSVAITVNDVNRPPIAQAGPDQTAECTGVPITITLNGAASSDPDGDALTYSWSENNAEVSTQVSPILSLAKGSHTFTLVVSDGKGGDASDQVVVDVVDTTPPVVTLKGDASLTIECHTSFSDPGASATDACDGPVPVVTSGSVNPDQLGTYTLTYTAADAAHNSASLTRAVQVLDTTAPTAVAWLTPVSSSRDEDDDKDAGNLFRAAVSATDACDPNPVVTAYITQPLTPASSCTVSYKREKKNRIGIEQEKRRVVVRLKGPDEAALRALWAQALAQGGFPVVDRQVVRLDAKRDNHPEAKFQFDKQLRLISAKTSGLRLVAFATDASGNKSAVVTATPPGGRKAVAGAEVEVAPARFALEPNYPNPFNPSTRLRYALDDLQEVRLVIYNVTGQQVRVLVDQAQGPGNYEVTWDARDASGFSVAPGLYLYRLEAEGQVAVGKMMLAK